MVKQGRGESGITQEMHSARGSHPRHSVQVPLEEREQRGVEGQGWPGRRGCGLGFMGKCDILVDGEGRSQPET